MLFTKFRRYFVCFLFSAGIAFSQNPQYLNSKIFFSNNYFFDIDSLAVIKKLEPKTVYYGQNDTVVFAGNTKDISAYSKLDFHKYNDLDTSLFYELNSTGTAMNWNIVYLNGKKFSLDSKTNIISVFDGSGSFIMDIPSKELTIDRDINGRDMLLMGNNSVVHVKDLNGEGGYIITAYDASGYELWTAKTPHTDIEAKGDTRYYKRYLNYYKSNSKYLIFTNNWFYKENPRTVIIDLETGKMNDLPVLINGVVFDNKDNIAGLLQYDEKENIVTFSKGINKEAVWEYQYNDRQVSPYSITALVKDNILVLALYYPISTGSDLVAVDLNNGQLKWHAKVDQVNTSHSKYYNHVNLFSYKDKVLMEGIESYGRYLQVFDINTGAKIYSDLNTR